MAKYHTNKGLRPLISVLLRTRFKKGSKLEVIRRFPSTLESTSTPSADIAPTTRAPGTPTTPFVSSTPTPTPEFTTSTPVEGVNLTPAADLLQFARTNCQGSSYSSIVEITSPEQLVPVIKAISEQNSENWVQLSKEDCRWVDCPALPWNSNSEAGGVLYLLPPGSDYVIQNYISDHAVATSSRKKRAIGSRSKRSHQSRIMAPRIGLCGLGLGSDSRSEVIIQLQGGTANTIEDGNEGDAPIKLSETQLELYNLTLDGSQTHGQQSSIILYKARLIGRNVAFIRAGNIMTTRGSSSAEASESSGFVEYGLVYLDYSYLHFSQSSLKQDTDTGSMINGFESNMSFIDGTEMTPYERTWIFYSYYSSLTVHQSSLTGFERNQSRPVLIDTHDEYKILDESYRGFCNHEDIQSVASQCSSCNPTDYCWVSEYYLDIPSGSDYSYFTSCRDIDDYCKNNNLEFSDNHLGGHWEYLAHSFYDNFITTNVTSNQIDSHLGNCLIDSVRYLGTLQISLGMGPLDCVTSHAVPEAATVPPVRRKRSDQPMGSRAVYDSFRAFRLLTELGSTQGSEVTADFGTFPTSEPPDPTEVTGQQYSSANVVTYSVSLLLMTILAGIFL